MYPGGKINNRKVNKREVGGGGGGVIGETW